MFNIQPGTGLGFTGSKEIAFGLGTPFLGGVIIAEVLRLTSGLTLQLSMESPIDGDN